MAYRSFSGRVEFALAFKGQIILCRYSVHFAHPYALYVISNYLNVFRMRVVG